MSPHWKLWTAQVAAILRLELKKTLLSRRGWWMYLLFAGPPLLTFGHSLHVMSRGSWNCTIGEDGMIYATIFQFFYLRLAIFFGCLAVFGNLFRGEVLEKTLHLYLLAPVRREVLLAGKYLAGLIAAIVIFGGSAALAFIGIFLHFGQGFQDFLWRGPGLQHLGWYSLVMVLACIGYGAVFLAAGVVFRNPMFAGAVVMVWESINGYVPEILQKFSVIFYLKSLAPVEVPLRGPLALIAVVGEPVPAWLAIPGLLVVSLLVLLYAAAKVRQMEVSYSE
ncbi:MAG TPA: ABC transporter permease [Bryobacteraceae bacterium]|nr:ABC transporter permease [Bryobacteraceae bacterium]